MKIFAVSPARNLGPRPLNSALMTPSHGVLLVRVTRCTRRHSSLYLTDGAHKLLAVPAPKHRGREDGESEDLQAAAGVQ